MRLFVAVSIPKEEKDRIYRASRVLRDQDFPVRWVNPDLFHLTLKFLGEVPTEKKPEVEKVLEEVGVSTGSFTMDIGGFGAFPTLRRPRVLWVGVDPSPALRCLKQDIEWGLSEYGFQRETRAFHPHFTLGRSTTDGGAGSFRGLDGLATALSYGGRVEVQKLDLMESHLSSTGPRYVVLSSFPLKGTQGR